MTRLVLGSAPEAAFDASGEPRAGVYRGTLAEVGLARRASALELLLRRKTWQYVAVVSETVVAAAAIADLGYVGLAFALAWDRERRRWYEVQSLAPLGFGIRTEGEPGRGAATFSGRSGAIRMLRDGAGRRVTADVRTPEGPLVLDWRLPAAGTGPEPLTVVARFDGDAVNVTHKEAGLDVTGTVRMGDRTVELGAGAQALFDWSQGLPPYAIHWNWAMGAGRGAGGERLAFNLCAGFNDRDDTENAVWVDGKLHRVDRVRFTIGEGRAPWRVTTEDGALDLTFEPEQERAAADDFLVVVSRYRQPVGRFRGCLPGADGKPVQIAEASGVAEDHLARW